MSEFIEKDLIKQNDFQDIEIQKLKEINKSQESEIKKLKNKIKKLEKVIEKRNERDAEFILEYFESSGSIRDTANYYDIKVSELFELIPEWDGCHDGLEAASDYTDCRLEVLGRNLEDEENESEMTPEELEERIRTPDAEEVAEIIKVYKEDKTTLYDIADNYNLKINNLFRILKENGIIENETDVNDYKDFYREYCGTEEKEWDGKSNLGLLCSF
jgi:phage antirepressor YoqD-like protein